MVHFQTFGLIKIGKKLHKLFYGDDCKNHMLKRIMELINEE